MSTEHRIIRMMRINQRQRQETMPNLFRLDPFVSFVSESRLLYTRQVRFAKAFLIAGGLAMKATEFDLIEMSYRDSEEEKK